MTTQYITQAQLSTNSNASFGLNSQLQDHLASQNAQFIVEISRDLKTSYSIPTLALHIASSFFHKRSYLHYDRFVLLAAAYLLASKIKNMDCRVKNICNALHNVITRKTMSVEPFNEEKMKKLKEHISIYETQVLRTLEYEIDSFTPHDYLKKECELLFSGDKEVNRRVYATTRVIILDSYRCRCCLVFSPLVIFLACFLIASRYEGRRPYDCAITRGGCKSENPKQEELYNLWLEAVGSREGQEVTGEQVRDCLRMINSVLPKY